MDNQRFSEERGVQVNRAIPCARHVEYEWSREKKWGELSNYESLRSSDVWVSEAQDTELKNACACWNRPEAAWLADVVLN